MRTRYGELRAWWPVCPQHGEQYVRALNGWIYCQGHGWHLDQPTDEQARDYDARQDRLTSRDATPARFKGHRK